MTTYTHDIEIKAPVEDAFQWWLQPGNWQRALPALTGITFLEETEEDRRYLMTYRVLGRSLTTEALITVPEENAQLTTILEGPDITGDMQYFFSDVDGITQLRLEATFETTASRFERVTAPVLRRYLDRQFRTHVQTMKDLVEAGVAIPA